MSTIIGTAKQIKSIQYVNASAVASAGISQTITIAAVNAASTVVIVNGVYNPSATVDTSMVAYLLSATQVNIQAVSVGSPVGTMTAKCTVIEYYP